MPGTLTFSKQAKLYLEQAAKKRTPLRPRTLETYEERLKNDVLPYIGHKAMEVIDNVQLKFLVDKWADKKVSRSRMKLNISVIKEIVASAVNERGERLYNIQWNPDFWDLPAGTPKKATVDAQTVQDAISKAPRHSSALIALLAGTGLRIGEALGLTWDNWYDGKLIIKSQFGGAPTKTQAGVREVDLAPELNDYLVGRLAVPLPATPSTPARNTLFPYDESTYRHAFKKAGLTGGFHTLRRFRSTYLDLMNCPGGLKRYWIGHSAGDVHEGYEQFGKEIQARKDEAARIGLGFKLP